MSTESGNPAPKPRNEKNESKYDPSEIDAILAAKSRTPRKPSLPGQLPTPEPTAPATTEAESAKPQTILEKLIANGTLDPNWHLPPSKRPRTRKVEPPLPEPRPTQEPPTTTKTKAETDSNPPEAPLPQEQPPKVAKKTAKKAAAPRPRRTQEAPQVKEKTPPTKKADKKTGSTSRQRGQKQPRTPILPQGNIDRLSAEGKSPKEIAEALNLTEGLNLKPRQISNYLYRSRSTRAEKSGPPSSDNKIDTRTNQPAEMAQKSEVSQSFANTKGTHEPSTRKLSDDTKAAIIADLQQRDPKLRTLDIASRNGVGKNTVNRMRRELEGKTLQQKIQEMKDALPAYAQAGLSPQKIAEIHDIGRETVRQAMIKEFGKYRED